MPIEEFEGWFAWFQVDDEEHIRRRRNSRQRKG